MINLAWNTHGRIGRRAYNDATGRIGFMNLLGLVIAAAAIFFLTRDNTYLAVGAVSVIMAALFYLQYRYAQLSIRRLHDRGLPGWLYFPIMLFGLITLGWGGYLLLKALLTGGLFAFVSGILGLIDPLVPLFFYKGIGFTVAILLVIYHIFVSWNLGAEGKIGDNRYGPDPHER